ncbi:unnamed protein product [Parnassius apollo]|uniref:(apollo) hypothetical protein n=1 Tax=Parnassius apollo TaxID=110799 RepID=A0A8S3XF17_PARAO|nr:unnamed protein product [Parnassius apollo]
MSHFASYLDVIDDKTHGLLEPPSVAYSNVTVRRAFIVWMYCGQKNKFQDVCNYFHYLEALEEKLSAEGRASSRHHEFDLFTNQPPTSTFLALNFPKLYTESLLQQHIAKVESCKHDASVIKMQEFDKIVQKSGTSGNEIVEASKMIRNYCKMHMKTLERFLKEFKEHTEKCGLSNTVGNVAFYIKRKTIQAEIELEANYAMTLELLARNDAAVEELSTNIQVQCKTVRAQSEILRERNSLNAINTKTLVAGKNCKKISYEMPNVSNSKLRKEFANKFQIIDKNGVKDKENIPQEKENKWNAISEAFLDRPLDCGGIDETMFRTRRFSGSNFIKRDILKLRKI